jgi:DNA-binding NarL/FixJ family response regulator
MRRRKSKAAPAPAIPQEPAIQETDRVSVVIVDPLPVVNEGLGLFIDSQDDMDVVAQAFRADDALRMLSQIRKRTTLVVLVALEMTGEKDAYWLIRQIREIYPMASVVACSAAALKPTVSRALFSGADGYINKRSDPPEFLDGIRRSAKGELVLTGLPTDWFGDIAHAVANEQDNGRPLLTDREREVLTIAAEGVSAKTIADRLGLSERTVTTHFTNIYKKLGAKSRVEAITAAARSGLVNVDLSSVHEAGGF